MQRPFSARLRVLSPAIILLLSAAPAAAQTTYTWGTGTNDNAWLTPANWTGGVAGTFPGNSSNIGLPNGNAFDTAVFGAFSSAIGSSGVGIDFTNNTGAQGVFGIGAIQLTTGAGGDLKIGNLSTTENGILFLNGATVSSISNVVLANTSGNRNLIIDNVVGAGTRIMELRLSPTNGVFLVNSGGTITINTAISTDPVTNGFTVQGGGALVLNAANTFAGPVTVTGGSTLRVSQDSNFGGTSGIPTANSIVLNNGTLNVTTGFVLNTNRGVTIGTGVAGGTGAINVSSGQTLTYDGIIANNTLASQLNKAGAGTLVLGGPNIYTGGTLISNGTVILNNLQALGTAGQQTVAPTGTNDGALLVNVSGSFARLVATGVTNDTSTGRLVIGSQTGVAGDVTFAASSLPVRRAFTIQGGATRTIFGMQIIQGGTTPAHITISAPVAATTGARKVLFTNPATASTYGDITIGDSVGPHAALQFGNGSASGNIVPDNSVINFFKVADGGGGGSLLIFSNGSATGETIGALNSLEAGAGTITTISGSGNPLYTLTVGGGNKSGNFSGVVGQGAGVLADVAITKIGNGTQTFSGAANTYTGATTITGGVLSISTLANGGSNSSIGASASAAANLVLNGGTLQYTGNGGAAGTTDRLFTLGAGATAGTLDASGTGAVNFTSTSAVVFAGSGARTLTLTGSNTGANTLSAIIGDEAGGATSLVKSGAGTWVLGGVNTFTGATTVSGGMLLVGTGGSLAAGSAVAVNSGGTLAGTGAANGLVTFASGGSIRAGNIDAAGTLTLNGGLNLQSGSNLGVRINVAGTAGVAAGSGGSSNSLTNPTNHNYLLVTGGTSTLDPAINVIVDGTGIAFEQFQVYSYKVAQLSQSQAGLNITDTSRFTIVGFQAQSMSLTGDAGGAVYLNFTPVPEPATILGLAAGALGLGGLVRRRRAGIRCS